MWYVDHIYMLSLALIILLSLLRIWIKRLFRWRLFPSWYRGKDQFPRGVRQQNLNPPVVTLRSYAVNHFTCHQSTSPFYCLFKPPVYVEVLWKKIYSINQVKERNLICLLENNVGGGKGAPLSEVFPTTKLLWNLVNGIYLLVVWIFKFQVKMVSNMYLIIIYPIIPTTFL